MRSVPTFVGNLPRWANELTSYLRDQQGVDQFTGPQAIQLVHQKPSLRQSAAKDGVIMYDPTTETIVMSDGGTWRNIATRLWVGQTYVELAGDTMTGALILENGVELRGENTSGTPQDMLQALVGTNDYRVGGSAWGTAEIVTGSSGTIEFYCGLGNLDVDITSNRVRFYDSGTPWLDFNAGAVDLTGTLDVTGTVDIGGRLTCAVSIWSDYAGSMASPVLYMNGNTVKWGLDTTSGGDFRISRDAAAFLTLHAGGSSLTDSTSLTINNTTNGSAITLQGINAKSTFYRTATAANSNFMEWYTDVFTTQGSVALMQNDGDWFNYNGTYGTISDVSLKENIADAPSLLSTLRQLRVRRFSRKDDPAKTVQIGFIAQEVEAVQPRLVATNDENGLKAVRTSLLTPMLVKSVQEIVDRLVADKADLTVILQALQASIDALTTRVDNLENP